MIPSAIKQALGRNLMAKDDLIKLANRLGPVYNCVAHFEALEEKRGYDNGKQFPTNLYKGGTQKLLLDHWLSDGPDIYVLDGDGYNFDAGVAGCEWAAFLRVRDPSAIVLRVYPKDRTAKAEHILCQLLSSLIFNLAVLVPEKVDKVPDLCKTNFELLAQGGPRGIDAGLRILEALPPLDLNGGRMLCIVDGLNRAEEGNTIDKVKQLTAVLGRILARNNGRLLCTMAKKTVST
ncbi:hypothetical protein F5B22DRAFT_533909 [Xylaria bambusicola]|uniref:uncharacterized protein n=1 Tax=Xylaria bambusicola TaxID=326684 RepID=UPI002007B185|nr:uncharacterized protein F5B22DRAFT_533909 [Xylaria bambusicola]KAI0505223.1 hypothetical protein F5B22DRAFT_533909 [Xylaria bambusicola]